MIHRRISNKSDYIGAAASSLCLIHCIATPFLFIAHSSAAACCESSPIWWQYVDYLFIIVAFFAIYQTTKTTSSKLIKPLLWFAWLMLFGVIINERLNILWLPNYSIYIPAVALIILHLFNLSYCQCKDDVCCSQL